MREGREEEGETKKPNIAMHFYARVHCATCENQVLQRPIDKPDNKEELLKFVYPNIGYNDGQATVTAQNVKDYEAKGLSTIHSVETQLLEAVLRSLSQFHFLVKSYG